MCLINMVFAYKPQCPAAITFYVSWNIFAILFISSFFKIEMDKRCSHLYGLCFKTGWAPGWLSGLGICLRLRSWSQGPLIEPQVLLSAQRWASFSLSLCLPRVKLAVVPPPCDFTKVYPHPLGLPSPSPESSLCPGKQLAEHLQHLIFSSVYVKPALLTLILNVEGKRVVQCIKKVFCQLVKHTLTIFYSSCTPAYEYIHFKNINFSVPLLPGRPFICAATVYKALC